MTDWQQVVVFLFLLINVALFFISLTNVTKRRKAFNPIIYAYIIGVFVWGDALIICPFWVFISSFSLLLNSWYLFLLFICIFWVVRSMGETIYWLNQQFSNITRNPPEKLMGYRYFGNESIWFAYQLVHQCVVVISIISSIYVAQKWLNTMLP